MLEGLTPPTVELICPLMRNATDKLDDKDLKILIEALADPRWTSKNLVTELTNRGFQATLGQLQKHRGNSCSCAK